MYVLYENSIYVCTLWQYYYVETEPAPTRVTKTSGFQRSTLIWDVGFLEIEKGFDTSPFWKYILANLGLFSLICFVTLSFLVIILCVYIFLRYDGVVVVHIYIVVYGSIPWKFLFLVLRNVWIHTAYEFIYTMNSVWIHIFFAPLNIWIHTIMNSYKVWIHIFLAVQNKSCESARAASARRERAARAVSVQREPQWQSPSSPPAPTRPRPAAPTVRVACGSPDSYGCVRLPW